MTPQLPRLSTIECAAAHLRERLEAGEWKSRLPGERWLSERLGISRPTLRAALAILEKEKYFSSAPNRARTILRGGSSRKRRLVFLHGTAPVFRDLAFLNHLRSVLHAQGIDPEEIGCGPHPDDKSLHALVERHPHRCWALLGVSQAVQQWFARQKAPAMVLGSAYPEVQLPSVDIDQRATGRHAANTFLRLGHRSLALVLPPEPRAGDFDCKEGFFEAARLSPKSPATARFVHARRDASELCQHLKRLFSSGEPPTAILACHPALTLTTLTWCLGTGRKIPQDISILSRDEDPHLDSVQPAVARYVRSEAAFTRKAVDLMLAMMRGAAPPARQHLLLPRLVRAASLGPAPK